MVKKNPRRQGETRTEHGPRWENQETDRNSARSRSKWKRLRSRSERLKPGKISRKFRSTKKPVSAL